MKMKKSLVVAACLSTFAAGHVFAHTTILGKFDASTNTYSAHEPDGVSAVNDFSIPHGCNEKPVRATTMLFPNGGEIVVEDQNGVPVSKEDFYAALEEKNNVIMGPKPALDANWKKQKVLTGPVPLFNNHGDKDEDVRAFVYKKGNLPNEFLSLSRWRAKFAEIKDTSCVKSIEVRIPIVNYCTHSNKSDSRIDAWIGRPTAVFNDNNGEVLSDGFWPRISIENTGYDEGECGPDGTIYKVSPSDADIDKYLPLTEYHP